MLGSTLLSSLLALLPPANPAVAVSCQRVLHPHSRSLPPRLSLDEPAATAAGAPPATETRGVVTPTNCAAKLDWHLATFEQLTNQQLYDALSLRQRVFIVEQTCLFNDIDEADDQFLHLLAYDANKLVGYTRMGGVGASYPDALTIGRVVVDPSHRGRGLSYPLMERSIDAVRARFGEEPITIGAQAQLQDLYTRLGFVATSEEYLEDDIPHIDMTLTGPRREISASGHVHDEEAFMYSGSQL